MPSKNALGHDLVKSDQKSYKIHDLTFWAKKLTLQQYANDVIDCSDDLDSNSATPYIIHKSICGISMGSNLPPAGRSLVFPITRGEGPSSQL